MGARPLCKSIIWSQITMHSEEWGLYHSSIIPLFQFKDLSWGRSHCCGFKWATQMALGSRFGINSLTCRLWCCLSRWLTSTSWSTCSGLFINMLSRERTSVGLSMGMYHWSNDLITSINRLIMWVRWHFGTLSPLLVNHRMVLGCKTSRIRVLVWFWVKASYWCESKKFMSDWVATEIFEIATSPKSCDWYTWVGWYTCMT